MTRGRLRSGRLLRMLVASIGLAAGSSILLGSDPGAHDDLPPPSDPDSSERVSVSESVTVKASKPEPPIPLPVEEVSVEVWREER